MPNKLVRCAVLAASTMLASAAWAQQPAPSQLAATEVDPAAPSKAAIAAAPDHLTLYFETGSTVVRPQDRPLLDKAARLYRDAHPITMIVAGGSDSVGSPISNLILSDARAQSVLRELVARGIPAERFQILAKGALDPAVHAPDGAAEPANRNVEIHWR